MNNIWKILGIEPTTDTRAIKKAYAAQVKNCHQEDEPERWQELHEAYKQALAGTERGQVPVRKVAKKKSEPESGVDEMKRESTTRKKAVAPKKKEESKKETPKEVRKVKLEVREEVEENKTIEEQALAEENSVQEEHKQYNEMFEKISSEQRINERREHILKNFYKLISMPPEGHCATFKSFLDNPKLKYVFRELAFWQALSEFLRKASTTSATYECISKKISELLNDDERYFDEDVIAEMQAAQMLSQAKYREKKAKTVSEKNIKRDIRGKVLQLLGLIIVCIFLLLVFGDGSPEDWGRFIVRLLRTIVRIL